MSIDRRPTAIAYKATIGLLSLPTALGIVPLPGSLADSPPVYAIAAAAGITLGCAFSLLGLLWPGRPLTGMTIEQVGLIFIAVGCGLYAGALLGVNDHEAVQAYYRGGVDDYIVRLLQGITFAFGFSAGIGIAAVVQSVVIRRYRKQHVVKDDG